MSPSGMKHPPKKKHKNKPRPEPIVPISDEERAVRSEQEFDKSLMHLNEAEGLAAWGNAPSACVHSAYYAMEHCAIAVLLVNGGVGKLKDVPQSHEHIIQHFGKLVEGKAGILGECGKLMSRARTERMTADYGLLQNIDIKNARETAADARTFVDACIAEWRPRAKR